MDHTIANGCFMLAKFDTRTILRVGVDRTQKDSYYVMFGNTNWTSLEPGKQFDLTFQLDNNSPWNGSASTMQMGSEKYLRVNFTGTQFWTEFVGSTVLNITRNGAPVAKLNITGSKAAFDELVSCQKAGDAQTRAQDPFAH